MNKESSKYWKLEHTGYAGDDAWFPSEIHFTSYEEAQEEAKKYQKKYLWQKVRVVMVEVKKTYFNLEKE